MPDEEMLACILRMGELLLSNGAEAMRVEDTVTRLCRAYGFSDIHIFSIPSSIVLTVKTETGRFLTMTRRVRQRGTDLGCVARVNALSRRLCKTPLPAEQVSTAIAAILPRPMPLFLHIALYALVSAVFSTFFGGTAWDAVAAAGSGVLLSFAVLGMQKLRLNEVFSAFACSMLTGTGAAALTACGVGEHLDQILIGNIMLLIPGLAFTASLRDMISGDTISGLLGLCEAVLKALAIAAGFGAALLLFGR